MHNLANAQAILFDEDRNDIIDWWTVNDGVMGGLSEGTIRMNNQKAVFKGTVSTENNGGFSMVRGALNKMDVDSYSHFVLFIKGDGKEYQFRTKSNASQRHSYVCSFKTTGQWQEVIIPFDKLQARFRGREVNLPNFEGESLSEIAFLIGNKKNESFEFQIASIQLK